MLTLRKTGPALISRHNKGSFQACFSLLTMETLDTLKLRAYILYTTIASPKKWKMPFKKTHTPLLHFRLMKSSPRSKTTEAGSFLVSLGGGDNPPARPSRWKWKRGSTPWEMLANASTLRMAVSGLKILSLLYLYLPPPKQAKRFLWQPCTGIHEWAEDVWSSPSWGGKESHAWDFCCGCYKALCQGHSPVRPVLSGNSALHFNRMITMRKPIMTPSYDGLRLSLVLLVDWLRREWF